MRKNVWIILLCCALCYSVTQAQVINLLVDCSHDYSFNISDANRTQRIFEGINSLTACQTIHKLNLAPINALVVLMDGKMPYHERDAPYLLEYVANGGGLFVSVKTGGAYGDSLAQFLTALGITEASTAAESNVGKAAGIYPNENLAEWPTIEGRHRQFTRIVPQEATKWRTIYSDERGEPLIIARKLGKGTLITDVTGVYQEAINKREPHVTIMRKLLEFIAKTKEVEPLKGGGGWQFSEGYRWDQSITTKDGLKIHFNEYSKIYVQSDIKAYHKTVEYLTALTGLDEKQKAAQIKELNNRQALLQRGAKIDINISGVKELTLLTTDGGNGIGSDHSIFADNWLIDAAGRKTKVDIANARDVKTGYGRAHQDTMPEGGKLSIGGREFDTGIFLHANGQAIFEINGQYKRFQSTVGCHTQSGGSVGFKVLGDNTVLWDDGKVYTGGVPGGDPNDVNYVPDGVLFQLKYLPCLGAGFLLPQGSAVDLPPALKDDWQVHLGMLAHEMGHAWSFPFCEVIGEESSAFIFNNLVLHRHHGQHHGDSVTRRLIGYLKEQDLDTADLAQKAHNFKYYMFIDLMIREYGETVWKNYNLLKYAILNKPEAKWDAHATAWLWSVATGRDVFPLFAAGFGSHMDASKVKLPANAMKLGFDTEAVGRLYKVPLKKLQQRRDIFSHLQSFADVRAFYAKELAEKGHPKVEG